MMKVLKHPINLDKMRYLVFDLNAIYELERLYGSFDGFFEVIKDMKDQDLFNFLWVGLLHEEEMTILDPTIIELYNQADQALQHRIKLIVLRAFLSVWTGLDKENNESTTQPVQAQQNQSLQWDWTYYYHIGTVLLKMPEAVFWRCTPVKLLQLWKEYRRFNGLDKAAEQQMQANEAFIDQYV